MTVLRALTAQRSLALGLCHDHQNCLIPSRFYTFGESFEEDRAIAQAISRWLPTAAARVHTRV
jgi:hypothetical protein